MQNSQTEKVLRKHIVIEGEKANSSKGIQTRDSKTRKANSLFQPKIEFSNLDMPEKNAQSHNESNPNLVQKNKKRISVSNSEWSLKLNQKNGQKEPERNNSDQFEPDIRMNKKSKSVQYSNDNWNFDDAVNFNNNIQQKLDRGVNNSQNDNTNFMTKKNKVSQVQEKLKKINQKEDDSDSSWDFG